MDIMTILGLIALQLAFISTTLFCIFIYLIYTLIFAPAPSPTMPLFFMPSVGEDKKSESKSNATTKDIPVGKYL